MVVNQKFNFGDSWQQRRLMLCSRCFIGEIKYVNQLPKLNLGLSLTQGDNSELCEDSVCIVLVVLLET